MDPFVVVAIDEFHKMNESSLPTTRSFESALLESALLESALLHDETVLELIESPRHTASPRHTEMPRAPEPVSLAPEIETEPVHKVKPLYTVAYPSPVLTFFRTRVSRQTVLFLVVFGVFTFRHRQIGTMLYKHYF